MFRYTRPRSDIPGHDFGFIYWSESVQPTLLKSLFNFTGCERYSGNWYVWWRPDS
jgi:hypothetical protein